MWKSKRTVGITLAMVVLTTAACAALGPRLGGGRFGPRAGDDAPVGRQALNPPTPEPAQVEVQELIEVPEAARRRVDPVPEVDLAGYLIDMAYESIELVPVSTAVPAIEAARETTGQGSANAPSGGLAGAAAFVSGEPYVSPLLVTVTPFAPAPPLVVQGHRVLIPNAVNTASCAIANVGECWTTMPAGVDLHLTWTFGVRGDKQFEWSQAQVVITRDGQGYQAFFAGNGLDPAPPDPDSDEPWVLPVGATAEFRAGLAAAEPGYYSAALRLCLMAKPDCEAGRGWTPVGGDTIQFLIVPDAG